MPEEFFGNNNFKNIENLFLGVFFKKWLFNKVIVSSYSKNFTKKVTYKVKNLYFFTPPPSLVNSNYFDLHVF